MTAWAALVAAGLAASAHAADQPEQLSPSPAAAPALDPLEITGRTFAGLRLPVQASQGQIMLSASKVYSWTETDPPGLSGGGSAAVVYRLLLSGDARVRLGSYEFTARQAAVFAARLAPGEPDAGPDVWQVWVYLDRIGTAATPSSITVAGDRMPVFGIIRAPRSIELRADNLKAGRPDDPLVATAEGILAQRLRRMVIGEGPPLVSPEELLRQGQSVPALDPQPVEPPPPGEDAARIAEAARRLPPALRDAPIFPRGGEFTFVPGGDVQIVSGEEENAVVFAGGITVQYWDREQDRTHQLSAERAVIFLEPGPLSRELPELLRSPREKVRGIYLEGDVVAQIAGDNGRYTLRAPKVYYSIRDDRAMLIDAVFWTYDAQRGLPLYVRAKTISQESRNQFTATKARMTTSSFAEPDLAIGASTVTITRRETPEGEGRLHVDAKDITLRAGKLPFFYWPRLRGEPSNIPLRDLRFEGSSDSGAAVKTTWNAYSLVGIEAPSGNSADVLLDWYFDRGVGLGADMNWNTATARGGLLAYTLPEDNGIDVLATGEKKHHYGDFRGILLGEHRAMLNDEWTLFAEGAYISDENFVQGFFEPLARNRREFTTALYLRRLQRNTSLTFLGQTNLNDFIANEYLLQSPGYTLDRYPDIGYARLADDLLKAQPGLLTYSSEYRLTQMALNFPDVTPAAIGFSNPGRSLATFGILPNQSFADGLRAAGLSESPATRFDTRHELNMPMAAGPINITPFIVGRFTGYNDDFAEFSADASQPYRLWGSAGITLSTEIQRVDNSVESRVFDLHRIRHIIQPSLTLWHAGSSIDRVDLPTYDADVESIAEGSAARFAVDQTWQTQRGGPGRWRSVDFFRLGAEVVVASGDVDRESPIGRFFDGRPELSNLGDTFARVDAAMQLTEVLGLGALTVYDFDINQPAQTDVGLTLEQQPDFSAFVDLRYINALDQTSLISGVAYQLTPKYSFGLTSSYDTTINELQSISTEVRRRYPAIVLGVGYSYNNITSESSLSFVFQPVGLGRPGARLLTGNSAGAGFGG